jgi:antitoxin (DNA-binding transcriptional repressor) of toxin-antitoxin stability system
VTPSGNPPRAGSRRSISATEAARNFGRIVDAVREAHVEYVVERGGVSVARIAPVTAGPFSGRDLVDLLRDAPYADAAFAREVAAGRSRADRPAVPKNPWAS